jgi:hypothetical protein
MLVVTANSFSEGKAWTLSVRQAIRRSVLAPSDFRIPVKARKGNHRFRRSEMIGRRSSTRQKGIRGLADVGIISEPLANPPHEMAAKSIKQQGVSASALKSHLAPSSAGFARSR